jgi:hypothetical protein
MPLDVSAEPWAHIRLPDVYAVPDFDDESSGSSDSGSSDSVASELI